MMKLLDKPEEVKVTSNIEGIPLTLVRNGKVERVIKVYRRWQVIGQMWGEEILKGYFRIKTSSGLVCDIYRDEITKAWYLSQIH